MAAVDIEMSPWVQEWWLLCEEAQKLTVVEKMSSAESSRSSSSSDTSSEEENVKLCAQEQAIMNSETQERDIGGLGLDIRGGDEKLVLTKLAKNAYPDDYSEVADLKGASAVYQPTILQLRGTQKTPSHTDGTLCKKDFDEDLFNKVQVLCGEEPRSVWMSSSLPAQLNLPIDCPPPPSTVFQLFLLSPGLTPFVLTIYDAKKLKQEGKSQLTSKEIPNERSAGEMQESPSSIKELQRYTRRVCMLLMDNLLNYCSCDFLLLPCCLSMDDMREKDSPNRIKKELQKQLKSERTFYGGPIALSQSTFNQINAAAVAVSGVSDVPQLMYKDPSKINKKCDLVLMDDDWRETVSVFMEAPVSLDYVLSIQYPRTSAFKTKVAIVEAAKRLSFVDDVLLITCAPGVISACRELNKVVLEETGVKLKLTAKSPSDRLEIENIKKGTYVFLLDCPPDFTDMMCSSVKRQTEEPDED